MAEKLDINLLNQIPDLPVIDMSDPDQAIIDAAKDDKGAQQDDLEFEEPLLEVDSLEDFTGEPVEPTPTEPAKSENYGMAKMLVTKGYMEDFEDDDFEDSEDWVEERLTKALEAKADSVLDPRIKEINDIFKKGGNLDQLVQIQSNRLTLESITDEQIAEDEELSENLIMHRLRLEGYDEDESKDMLQTYKDADLVTKEAIRSKKKLKAAEDQRFAAESARVQQEEQRQKEDETRRLSTLKSTIENAQAFIPGVNLSKQDKAKLFEAVVNRGKDGYTEYERLLMDPDNQLKVLQFLVQLGGDFTKAEAKIVTKVTKNMKKTVDTYKDEDKNSSAKAMKALDYLKQYSSSKRFI